MMAIDTGHVAQQAPAGPLVPVAPAPPPVPALTNPGLKANVVSYQLWQAKTQIPGEISMCSGDFVDR